MTSEQRESTEDASDALSGHGASPADIVREFSSETAAKFAEAAKSAAEQARSSAASLADQAATQTQDFLRDQIKAGAALGHEGAEAAREFADRLDAKAPHVAEQTRRLADQVDNLSKRAEKLEPRELLDMTSDYARRQPLAFTAAAMVLGFLAVRFLKRATPRPGSTKSTSHSSGDSTDAAHDA